MIPAERTEEVTEREAPTAVARMPAGTVATAEATALRLQQTAGNRVVSRLVSEGALATGAAGRALARAPTQVRGSTNDSMVGGGGFVGRTRFEFDIRGEQILVTVKIKLRKGRNVTDVELAATKVRAAATFNAMWDGRFIITDASRNERYFVRTEVQWVDSGEHISVLLRAGDEAIDQINWSVGDQSIEFAHEISHTLGLKDEYVDPRSVARRTATSPGVRTDHSLMGNYFTEGIAQAEVKLRSGQTLANNIGRAMRPRRNFVASFSGIAQGERLVRWRAIRDAATLGTAERTAAAAEVTAIEADLLIPQISAAAGVPYAPTP